MVIQASSNYQLNGWPLNRNTSPSSLAIFVLPLAYKPSCEHPTKLPLISPSMAVPTPKPSSTHPQLGQIVILGLPSFLKRQDKEFTSKFQFLSPSESNLPLDQFLAAEAQNTQAAVCSGGFKISADVLRHLPSLRLIVTTSTGFNQIDLSECRKRGISVANAGNIYSADVADLAVGMIIDVMRKISAGNRFVKSGLWPKQGNFPLGSKVHYLSSNSITSCFWFGVFKTILNEIYFYYYYFF